jgi:hypothetical protein
MWYVSFHGGQPGENNIHVYDDDGKKHSKDKLLPTGDGAPKLSELRAFAFAGNLLYAVNGQQSLSQILVYEADANGDYTPRPPFASKATTRAIVHPYDLAFDQSGNCYVSNQDTNVVAGLDPGGKPLPVATYLTQSYPPPATFLPGTIVASQKGALPHVDPPAPPDVEKPQGLCVEEDGGKVAHSVRGVLCVDGYLYVADEPAGKVRVYDLKDGKLHGEIAGNGLAAPVQLLLDPTAEVLYIAGSGDESVMRYDVSRGAPVGRVQPEQFVSGGKKLVVSGIAVAGGSFYVAERKARKILKFPADGSGDGKDFITGLTDDPEFIVHR